MTELFLEMVNRSISASYLVALIVVLRIVFRRIPKWVVVALWGFVAFRLICPVVFESRISLIPSAEVISSEILLSPMPAVQTGLSSVNDIVNPVIGESFAPDPAASANPLQIVVPVLGQVWLLGMVVMALYTILSYLRLRRQVSDAVVLDRKIYQSNAVASPFILGLFRPYIYLPGTISQEEMQYVIAHEQTHIHRRDHWWKPLGFALLTLTWFHPLMWAAYVLLCRDIELACDEAAVKQMEPRQRAAYSQTLLNLSVPRRQIAACPLAFGEVGVKQRVKRVLSYRKPGFWILVLCLVLCVAIAVTFLTVPSEKGLTMLQALREEDIATIHSQTILKDMTVTGTVFYTPEDHNLHRILPLLNQVKGTPISKPWGAKNNADVRFITIFLDYGLWDSAGKFIQVEIVNNRYLVVDKYWYEADEAWLATLPEDRSHYDWLTGLSRDVILDVEFHAEPGSGVYEQDVYRLIQFLNRMHIPAVGYPEQLPPVRATYRITTVDGVTRELSILGANYLMIDGVLYDVGESLVDLTQPPHTFTQLPLPEELMAVWVRVGNGQPVGLIYEKDILDQLLALLNQGTLQNDADPDMECDAVLVLFWPNGDVLNLLLSSHGAYFKMGAHTYSYGSFGPDEPMKNIEQLWRLFGFEHPVSRNVFSGLAAPGYLENTLFENVVVMQSDTIAVSGQSWKEGNTRECDHAYSLYRQDEQYQLRILSNDGTIRTHYYRKMMPIEHDGMVYHVLTNSRFALSSMEDVDEKDYVLWNVPESTDRDSRE